MSGSPREALRSITTADVHKAGRHAGILSRSESGAVTFSYLPGYGGPAIASTLPVGLDPVTVPGGGLPAFFAGLLPEGHRLTVLRREIKTSADDELSVLLAVGADTPGDVQVVPVGSAPLEPPPLLHDDVSRLDFRALTSAPDRHGIPGVQAKASATMLTSPLATRGMRALLKIDPAEHPHLVENEAAHMGGARALRLPVAEHAVVRDGSGTTGLLVTRFDRAVGPDGSVRRAALEDAAQVLGLLPAAKHTPAGEDVVRALAARTAAPRIAVRSLYLQFLFAWLTGNGGLHAKNLSTLQALDGRWNVAPIYDVACTAVYRDFSMALPIDGRTTRLRRRHWDAFAESIGLPPRAALSAQRLALTAAGVVDLAALPFEGSLLRGAERELHMRRAELEG